MKQILINTIPLEYADHGKGETLLFIHGTFANGNTWRKIIPALSKFFRCIVPDWPLGGHRIAVDDTADLSSYGIADLVLNFLDALKLTEVIIVANDTGGAYAQVFTAKYPERVKKLILSNCEGLEIFPPEKFKLLQSLVKIPGYTYLMSCVFRSRSFLKRPEAFGLLSHTLTGGEIFELYVQNFVLNKLIRKNFKKLVAGWNPKYTIEAAYTLATFKNPVLIIWGRDDKELFPLALGERISAIFPNSTFEVIDSSLTYVQEDQPEKVIHLISKFVNTEINS
jgi:pimeloyl-ACP methyl ester carboxylesterase